MEAKEKRRLLLSDDENASPIADQGEDAFIAIENDSGPPHQGKYSPVCAEAYGEERGLFAIGAKPRAMLPRRAGVGRSRGLLSCLGFLVFIRTRD